MNQIVDNSHDETVIREECISNFSGWSKSVKKAYFTGVFLIIFVIPLLIMFCLYTHILMQLRDNTRTNKRARLVEMGKQDQVQSSFSWVRRFLLTASEILSKFDILLFILTSSIDNS